MRVNRYITASVYLVLVLFIFQSASCSSNNIQNEASTKSSQGTDFQNRDFSQLDSGVQLISISRKYLNIAKTINYELVEGDYEDALKLLEIGADLAEELHSLRVSEDYKQAKEFLYNGIYYDLRSFAMIIDGMPIKEAEKVMNKGMYSMMDFVQEMNNLGHSIKF